MEVELVNGATGDRRTVRCARRCPLRHLQKRVCGAFGEDFPGIKAEIAVDGRLFKLFDEKPFWGVARTGTVWFTPTDDPYWLDVRDRRRQLLEGREPSPLRI